MRSSWVEKSECGERQLYRRGIWKSSTVENFWIAEQDPSEDT